LKLAGGEKQLISIRLRSNGKAVGVTEQVSRAGAIRTCVVEGTPGVTETRSADTSKERGSINFHKHIRLIDRGTDALTDTVAYDDTARSLPGRGPLRANWSRRTLWPCASVDAVCTCWSWRTAGAGRPYRTLSG
jgi:hypothetical protein